jgi:hypothetical protein
VIRNLYGNRYQRRVLTKQEPGIPSRRLRTFCEPFIEAPDTSALAPQDFRAVNDRRNSLPKPPKPSATASIDGGSGRIGALFSAGHETREGSLPASFTELKPLGSPVKDQLS